MPEFDAPPPDAPPGYEILGSLHAGPRSEVWRARQTSDGRAVVLKTTRAARPSPEAVARLEREVRLLERVSSPHVVRALAYDTPPSRPYLVMPDGGAALALEGPRPVAEAVGIAVQILEGLFALHRAGIVHRDLSLANVVMDAGAGAVRIVDLGLASLAPATPTRETRLEGTLAYLAPERTGRSNRPVDHRADYYALGVVLFALLSGRLPFTHRAPSRLIYAHLAEPPPALSSAAPHVPAGLEAVVARLLDKEPERRHPSASAIQCDLAPFLEAPRPTAIVAEPPPFPSAIGLHGRRDERRTLRRGFARAAAGGRQVVAISGEPGIGKTSLAEDLVRAVHDSGGWFGRGKCDQAEGDRPHAALHHALRDLVRARLLTDDDDVLARWRDPLAARLGDDAAPLVEWLPELQSVFPDAGPPLTLPPDAAQLRLGRAIRALAGSFTGDDAPLVLLVDDVQWADESLLRLLEALLTDPSLRYLLVVAAFRADDVRPDHGLELTLRALTDAEVGVERIALTGLEAPEVALVLRELRVDLEGAGEAPAERLRAHTLGNPLFLQEVLRRLHEAGHLTFDPASGRWKGRAEDLEAGLAASPPVIDLLAARLGRLDAQPFLSAAACIGARFDFETLSRVSGATTEVLVEALLAATRAGVVRPLDDGLGRLVLGQAGSAALAFTHDQIQRAAYDRLDEDERRRIRRSLALALDPPGADPSIGRAFEVAEHYNAALEVLAPAERVRAAEANLRAARQARGSSAHEVAAHHASAGARALPENARTAALRFELAFERAHAGSLTDAPWPELEAMTRAAIDAAPDPLRRRRAQVLLVTVAGPRGQHEASVSLGLALLRELGVDLEAPGAAADAWRALQAELGDRDLDRVIDALAATDDPEHVLLADLFRAMGTSLWATRFDLLVPMCLRLALHVFRHGATGSAPEGLAAAGYAVAHAIGDLDRGYALGQAALRLAERLGATNGGERHLVTLFLGWLRAPVRALVDADALAFREARAAGNFMMAGHAAAAIPSLLWRAQIDLPTLLETIAPYASFLAAGDHYFAQALFDVRRAASRLVEEVPLGPEDGNDDVLARLLAIPSPPGAHHHLFMRAELALVSGDYAAALKACERAAPYASPGEIHGHDRRFDHALCAALTADAATDALRSEVRDIVAATEGLYPGSFLHRATLLGAELARLEGRVDDAERGYAEALRLAREHRLPRDEGIIAELAARHYDNLGRATEALGFLHAARDAYRAWGARAKVAALEAASSGLAPPAHPVTPDTATQGSFEASQIDLDDLLRALQTISAEIDPERVVATLCEIVSRNAGARRCAVVTRAAGAWRAGDDRLTPDAAPLTLIRYVHRTREALFLDDATQDPLFGADPYMRGHGQLSAAALPLVAHGELVGVLYLEHDGAAGLFGTQRRAMVTALAAQAAIAVHNAHLFEARESLAARLGAILDTVGEGVLAVDRRQTIRTANREVEVIFGYGRGELVGQPLERIMPKKHRARHKAAFKRRLSNPEPMPRRYVEVEGQRKNGEIFPLELRFSQADVDGERLFVSAMRDISDRVRDRQEIERLSAALKQERDYLREEVRESGQFGEIVGESPALRMVLAQIGAVAETEASVLIHGESGVGKELLARAIHERSPRRGQPLVKVNCASIPKELFESEFFGHVKGAFTGAVQSREGRFALADGGTLFLDEIGEVPLDLQSKLLRVLQEREFERVGEAKTRKVDVRVVAATNRDLLAEVAAGAFREDLYYRLGVFPIRAPALRERPEDVLPLTEHFLRRAAAKLSVPAARLSPAAEAALRRYRWPGNIRELQNVIERASILARGRTIEPEMLGLPGVAPPAPVAEPPRAEGPALEAPTRDVREAAKPVSRRAKAKALNREAIRDAMARHDGVILRVAKDLGISRQALYRRMEKLGMAPEGDA